MRGRVRETVRWCTPALAQATTPTAATSPTSPANQPAPCALAPTAALLLDVADAAADDPVLVRRAEDVAVEDAEVDCEYAELDRTEVVTPCALPSASAAALKAVQLVVLPDVSFVLMQLLDLMTERESVAL